jgi:hypothetical protein
VFGNQLRDISSASLGRSRKPKFRLTPHVEHLEQRIALHGGFGQTAVQGAHPAIDVNAAATQVLNIMTTSVTKYGALQVQLDPLAAQLQKQPRSAQQKTVKTALTLISQFVTGENQRYRQILAIEKTVPTSSDFSALVQLERGVHKDLLSVQSVVGPEFKLLVGATYTTKKPTKNAAVVDAPDASKVGPLVQTATAHPADSSGTELDPDQLLLGLRKLLTSATAPLLSIANLQDDSGAIEAAKSLSAFNALLDVCLVFYQTLPGLSYEAKNDFVARYNEVAAQYDRAAKHIGSILATCIVHDRA